MKQPDNHEGKSDYPNDSRSDKRGGRLSSGVGHAPNDNRKPVDREGPSAIKQRLPCAAAFGLNAAGFALSPAISPPPRLRPFPPHQFDFDPAAQRMRQFQFSSF